MFKSLFQNKAQKIKNRILSTCSDLITKYEQNPNSIAPSCKDELETAISNFLATFGNNLTNWNDQEVDYIKLAHTVITNVAFDLLTSGKYHIYTGMLNPHKCGQSLRIVHDKSLEWGIMNGVISQQELDEHMLLLHKGIESVG